MPVLGLGCGVCLESGGSWSFLGRPLGFLKSRGTPRSGNLSRDFPGNGFLFFGTIILHQMLSNLTPNTYLNESGANNMMTQIILFAMDLENRIVFYCMYYWI